MRKVVLAAAMVSLIGCGAAGTRHGGGGSGGTGGGGAAGMGGGSGGTGGGTGGTGGGIPCGQANANQDGDGDGFSAAQGDCNDCDPGINPGAIEIPGNSKDDDCNGQVDDNNPACDTNSTGSHDPNEIAHSMEICDARFLKSATTAGPSDMRARNVLANFGILKPKAGANFALLSNGVAVDEMGSGFKNPQQGGTDLVNTFTNPLPNLMGSSSCGQADATNVHDYTEIVLKLHTPTNVQSFSFQFQFFSGEYPEFVCTSFNDEFLAIVQSSKTYPTPTNISYDAQMHPITVNSGFFTVCTNDTSKPQTQHCMHPPSDNNGTGYEIKGLGVGIPSGSTGWLSTTAPIEPNEDVTLRFVIFDEGDGDLDSAVLIDNFQWGAATVMGPSTGPIGYKVIKHHKAPAAMMCLSPDAPT